MSDGGKGDKPRPIPDRAGYERNHDAIDWNARARDGVQQVSEAPGSDTPSVDETDQQG